MAELTSKPTDEELKAAAEVLRWILDQAEPIRITIEAPAGSFRVMNLGSIDRPDTTAAEGEQERSKLAGTPGSAGALVEGGKADKTAVEKARQLLRAYGYNKPEWILREYKPERIIEVCMEIPRQKRKVEDPGAWINAALGHRFRWRSKG